MPMTDATTSERAAYHAMRDLGHSHTVAIHCAYDYGSDLMWGDTCLPPTEYAKAWAERHGY